MGFFVSICDQSPQSARFPLGGVQTAATDRSSWWCGSHPGVGLADDVPERGRRLDVEQRLLVAVTGDRDEPALALRGVVDADRDVLITVSAGTGVGTGLFDGILTGTDVCHGDSPFGFAGGGQHSFLQNRRPRVPLLASLRDKTKGFLP